MPASNFGERMLTELDFARLKRLTAAGAMPQLDELLDEADVVPARAIPADVVTMDAQMVVHDLKLQSRQLLAVCYPADAQPAAGLISVLSPAGLALVGLRVGAIARWTGPRGEESLVEIEAVLFQPEVAGDCVT